MINIEDFAIVWKHWPDRTFIYEYLQLTATRYELSSPSQLWYFPLQFADFFYFPHIIILPFVFTGSNKKRKNNWKWNGRLGALLFSISIQYASQLDVAVCEKEACMEVCWTLSLQTTATLSFYQWKL